MMLLNMYRDYKKAQENILKQKEEHKMRIQRYIENYESTLKTLNKLRFYKKSSPVRVYDIFEDYEDYLYVYQEYKCAIKDMYSKERRENKIKEFFKALPELTKKVDFYSGNLEHFVDENAEEVDENLYKRRFGDILDMKNDIADTWKLKSTYSGRPRVMGVDINYHTILENIFYYYVVAKSPEFRDIYFGGKELSDNDVVEVIAELLCGFLIADISEDYQLRYLGNLYTQLYVMFSHNIGSRICTMETDMIMGSEDKWFRNQGLNMRDHFRDEKAIFAEFFPKYPYSAIYETWYHADAQNEKHNVRFEPLVNKFGLIMGMPMKVFKEYPKWIVEHKGNYKNLIRYITILYIKFFLNYLPPQVNHTVVVDTGSRHIVRQIIQRCIDDGHPERVKKILEDNNMWKLNLWW